MAAAGTRVGLALVALVALGACASRSQDTRAPDHSYVLEIENNLAPSEPVDVYLVSPGGRTRLIGHVQAGTRRSFEFEEIAEGSYRLMARGRTNAGELTSPRFSLIGNRRIEWNLFGNLVSVLERR